MKYARQRDANEKEIVLALRAAGATVQQLDAKGCPDLLVGFRGVTYLLEVKRREGRAEVHGKRTASGLRETQDTWFAAWKGRPPAIVLTAAAAIEAIGAHCDEHGNEVA